MLPQPGFQDLTMQDVAVVLAKKPRVGYETPICTSSTYNNEPPNWQRRTQNKDIHYYLLCSGEGFSYVYKEPRRGSDKFNFYQAFKLSGVIDPGHPGPDQLVLLGML